MLCVPRAAMNLDLLGRRVAMEVFADMNRRKPERAGATAVEDGFVEETPEARLNLRSAKPATVLAVRPGRDQRGKVAVFRPLEDFVLKPTRVETRELGIGEFTVARHHDNFRAAKAC